MNSLIDRFSLKSYHHQGNIVASYTSFPLSLIIQEGDFKGGEIYIKENQYGAIGKIFHDFKKGAPVVLFQMLTENPSTGGHDHGIYLNPLVVNTTILHSQTLFKYQKDHSTGFISSLHVLTNKPCINGGLDESPLIKEFNLRLQKKIEFLKTKT